MPKSMTGFGQAQGRILGRRVSLEVRSVNHKYNEVNLRVPSRYFILEPRIIAVVKSHLQRGRIDVHLREEGANHHEYPLKIDRKKLKAFYRELKTASTGLGLSGSVDMNTLLSFPNMFLVEEEVNVEKYWVGLRPLLKKALGSLEKMRIREGKGIAGVFSKQLNLLKREIQRIEKKIPENLSYHRAQMESRLEKLALKPAWDPQRLAQEVAHFIDRTDISEEVQRFKSHLGHFGVLIKSSYPIGRKLDFLLQELMREVNTLSAKVQNADISQRVVECKHVLERMREQVQNLE